MKAASASSRPRCPQPPGRTFAASGKAPPRMPTLSRGNCRRSKPSACPNRQQHASHHHRTTPLHHTRTNQRSTLTDVRCAWRNRQARHIGQQTLRLAIIPGMKGIIFIAGRPEEQKTRPRTSMEPTRQLGKTRHRPARCFSLRALMCGDQRASARADDSLRQGLSTSATLAASGATVNPSLFRNTKWPNRRNISLSFMASLGWHAEYRQINMRRRHFLGNKADDMPRCDHARQF